MRITYSLVKVIEALLEDPAGRHWGYELSRRSHVRSGVLYPILGRLLAAGWLTDGWEDPKEISGKRPPRRYYEITGEGRRAMEDFLAEVEAEERFPVVKGRFA